MGLSQNDSVREGSLMNLGDNFSSAQKFRLHGEPSPHKAKSFASRARLEQAKYHRCGRGSTKPDPALLAATCFSYSTTFGARQDTGKSTSKGFNRMLGETETTARAIPQLPFAGELETLSRTYSGRRGHRPAFCQKKAVPNPQQGQRPPPTGGTISMRGVWAG